MDSLWTQTARLPEFPTMKGNCTTDVLIIGGGLTGLLCAHEMKAAGVDCMLVEKNGLCSGVTQNTTAKLTVQHGLIYHKLIRRFGSRRAGKYLQANKRALEEMKTLCRNMDCDFRQETAYVYSRQGSEKLLQEMEALRQLGCPAQFVKKPALPVSVAGAVGIPDQGQFHPLKFAAGIAEDLPIFTHTRVQELAPGTAVTDRGTIRAKKIIVATHFPMLNKHGSYFLKMYQHRSYVLALKGAPLPEGMFVDEAKDGLSFRSWGELLLLGGGGHRTGKKGGGWQELERVAQSCYPGAEIVARWATQDCMTLDDVPYIGQYSARTPDLFVATGFQKWGMTTAMTAAMLLTDLVQGKQNPYASVFDPSRSVLRPQLALNAAEAVLNLLTPTAPRCPHMGCALKYNPQEHSWDCPCHGSRFEENGRLIDNPSNDDLWKKKGREPSGKAGNETTGPHPYQTPE